MVVHIVGDPRPHYEETIGDLHKRINELMKENEALHRASNQLKSQFKQLRQYADTMEAENKRLNVLQARASQPDTSAYLRTVTTRAEHTLPVSPTPLVKPKMPKAKPTKKRK